MPERIYLLKKDGLQEDGRRELDPLEEAPFPLEDDLQALLAEHPELIDGEQVRPDDPRRWILIKREKGIAKTSDAGDHWALDLLLIDQDAIPTLVEVKRGSNSEIRRKVVGQMLEYAAHATGSWAVDDIRRDFEGGPDDPEAALRDLLRDDRDANDFWEGVRINLAAKRIRLLFVADRIPSELERIVTFLNEQMQNVEVLAVEIKQFSGESTRRLVPRVIGLTAAAPAKSSARSNLTRKSFLDDFTSDEARAAAERLLDTASKSGGSLRWNPTSVSLLAACPLHPKPVTVTWLYLPSTEPKSFLFGWGGPSYGYPPELEQRLRAWTAQFKNDRFSKAVGAQGLAWGMTPDDAAGHIGCLTKRLSAVLSDLQSLAAAEDV